jgi:hypothetical protein
MSRIVFLILLSVFAHSPVSAETAGTNGVRAYLSPHDALQGLFVDPEEASSWFDEAGEQVWSQVRIETDGMLSNPKFPPAYVTALAGIVFQGPMLDSAESHSWSQKAGEDVWNTARIDTIPDNILSTREFLAAYENGLGHQVTLRSDASNGSSSGVSGSSFSTTTPEDSDLLAGN